jgi:hypothetical protein
MRALLNDQVAMYTNKVIAIATYSVNNIVDKAYQFDPLLDHIRQTDATDSIDMISAITDACSNAIMKAANLPILQCVTPNCGFENMLLNETAKALGNGAPINETLNYISNTCQSTIIEISRQTIIHITNNLI